MRKVLYMLGQLDDDDIEWLIGVGTLCQLAPGKVLIREGEEIEALYIVLDGTLVISTAALQGGEVARLVSGEMIGEISFVDERPPTATVTALEPARVLALNRATLRHKLDQDSRFAVRFYRAVSLFLASRLRTTVGRLGYGSVGETGDASEHAEELHFGILDNVHLAGARFEHILKHFTGG